MSAIVSDTSPLNYLVLIAGVDLLPRLFSEVIIPPLVALELSQPKTPDLVRAWAANPPAWLRVRAPISAAIALDLDAGETQAIMLAKELGIASLLIDERKGFHAAESLGLKPIGLLGILELCSSRRWIDFDEYITRLRATSFRIHERLIAEAQRRVLSEKS